MIKKQFKGQGRTISDPPKAQKATIPTKETAPKQPPPPQAPPKPAGPLPTPENRSIKITERDATVAGKSVEVEPRETYELQKSDLKGIRVGPQPPREFGSRPAPKPVPKVAKVRFQISLHGKIINAESEFQTSEMASALYEFLETHVFNSVEDLAILSLYPRMLIPRDNTKALAAYKISGSIVLQVNCKDNAVLKSFH